MILLMVQMVRRLQRTLSKQTRDAVYTLDALTLFQCNDRIFVVFFFRLIYSTTQVQRCFQQLPGISASDMHDENRKSSWTSMPLKTLLWYAL